MKILLCAIMALPLVLFGVENAENNALDSTPKQTEQSDKQEKNKDDSKKFNTDSKDSDSKSSENATSDSAQNSAESTQISQSTKEESGWMIGVGFLMGGPVGNGEINAVLGGTQKRFDYGAEVILGHKTFFGESGIFGMRLYIDYNYRRTKGSDLAMHFLWLTIDTLFNIYQTEVFKFGMLAGVRSGIGFGFATSQCSTDMEFCESSYDIDWTADLNVGARFIIYDHNAFELVLQPRFGVWYLKGKNSMYGIVRYIYTF